MNTSDANQWVMSHGRPRYANTPMSPNPHQWAMSHLSEVSHILQRHISHILQRHISHILQRCANYTKRRSKRHTKLHTYANQMKWPALVANKRRCMCMKTNESCRTWCRGARKHINESWHTSMSHVTREWVVSHIYIGMQTIWSGSHSTPMKRWRMSMRAGL